MRLTVTGALLVDAASKIDATGCGYLGNLTLGNSTNGAATGYSGGSYGGLGFSTGGGSVNGVYGDYRDPNELGSGGAGDPTRTGAGGGLVRLTVGSAQIDGAIVVNGLAGMNFYAVGAPGSGGAIRIDVGTLSGSGKVSADGGSGAGGTGSGGGGRVAIYYQNLQGFNVGTQVTAHGGSGGDGAGAVGTVYLKQSGVFGKLLLASHGTAPGVWTPLGNSTNSVFQADTLEISGTNVIAAPPRGTVIRANAISVLSGAVLTVPATTTSTESSLQITVTNKLLVDANSRIDVSGCGYLGNYTLGNLTNGAGTGLSGGSYGGFGFAASGSPNAVYGDFRNPNELGSGGAGDSTRTGAGGGLLRLNAGSAQIDGAILANGLAGVNYYAVGGPGSGGGIRIDVGTLSGTGRVSADGGAAAGGTGSGGGGRVAIYYQIIQGFDLTTNVTAHAGAGGNGPGSVGTVYLKQVGGSEQLLISSHATPAAVWTPLGLPADTAYQVEQLLVSGDGVVAAPGHQMPLYARNLSVLKGAVLTHLPSTQAGAYSLFVTVTNNLLVDQTSKIDVSGRGYPGNYPISSSLTGPASGLSGASYGGLGVSSGAGGGSANAVYGDYQDPNNLGSGGAGDATRTGAGGGLVRLKAGNAQIDGAILANGIAGVNFYAVGGPGSGGGIRVDVGTLTGTGRISADGGAAAGGTGSGGGGRVAVYFQTLQSFDATNNVTAHAGSGGDGPGAVGTVFLKQAQSPGQLLLTSHGTPAGVWTPLGMRSDPTFNVDQLFISGTNVVAAPEHEMPIQALSIALSKGAMLTHQPTTAAQEYSLRIAVSGNLVVDNSSTIDVSARGYLGNYTLGNTNTAGATGTSGASYGGLGFGFSGSPNNVYGDYRDPAALGSGGAGDSTRTGAGGGLLRVTAANALIDGVISANGANGWNWYQVGGAGSGGAVRMDVGTLSGNGQMSANGGAGGGGYGAGAGGRLAIYYQALQGFDVANNVTAHAGSGGDGPAAVGTVYLKQSQSPGQLLLASHGTPAGVWTPLGMQTDTAFNVEQLFISGTNVMAAPIREMPILASSINLSNGAILTHQITTTPQEYSLRLTISDTLLVDPSSMINVSGRGYVANYTVGNLTNGAATGTSGGSFGGLGFSDGGTASAVYGDYHNPSSPGSGGGGDPSRAGAGGGLVRVTAGKAQIDGLILANGTDGWNWYQVGGAGSGGGIYFDVGTLSGSGRVSADGGAGGGGYGSGGGGRVAVYFKTLQSFDLANRLTARGGSGGDGAGGVGTIYVKQNGMPGELRLVNLGSTTGSWTPLGNPTDSAFLAENLTISGTNTVAAPAGGIPIRALSISLLDGAVLSVPATTSDQERSLSITVTNNLRVDARSKIDVSGTGYRGNYTLGNQTAGGATGTSGGSFGGLGYYQGGGSANSVYGDYRNPNELGSGGAGDASRTGAGGGLVRITADTAQIDGAVYANGIVGRNWYQVGGAGSGGGIRLDVNSLSGTGQISADGGNGGSGFGAGSGGRVALYYKTVQDFDFARKVTAHGGIPGDGAAAVGTVYLKQQGNPSQLLLLSHANTAGMWTPLGSDSDLAFVTDDLVIAGTNVVATPQHEMPIRARTVTITNGAGMTHQYTTAAQEYSLQLNIAGNLLVDASSKIDVTGRGYLGNYTMGNTTDGGARGNSGGSHGGLGYAIGGGQPNDTYGDERNPSSSGSGGGGDSSRTGSGGGIIRITSDTAQIEGAILADGVTGRNWYSVGGAGSGGSILLNSGIITGNGVLRANGGAGGDGFGAGGGGRVAVYNWNSMSLAVTNVTAAGGTGGNAPGQPGTVIFSGVPVFVWENARQFLHGTESIAWNVLGVGQGELHVQLSATRAGTAYPIGTSTNSYGTMLWDTRTVPDGAYVLNAVYNDLSGQYSGLISRDVLVNNALVWHSGSITNSQTWQAGVVHIVDGKVFVGPGGNVTIQPGAILKFTLGSGISVEGGAILNALATPSLPIILTSFKDDTAGGDSNLDGDRSLPQPGDWAGISVATTGQFNRTSSVDFRYLTVVHGGDLAADEGWEGTFIHIIKSMVTVPSGVTLTIAPGAVLKFASGAGLSVSSGGRLNALGTLAQPITFTSTRDDSVGGDSNNDSHLTQPAPGDWVGLNIGAAVANLKYCNVRYGGNTGSGAFASGMFIVNSGKLALTGCLIETALYDGLSIYGAGGSATLTNCILRDLDRAIWAWGGGNVQLLNSTFDDNVAALVQHGGATITAENCIIANSVQGSVTEGACTLSFCDLWSKYPNSSNPGVIGQNGNISADPRFVNASQKDYRLRYGSPCIDAADGTLAPLADFMGAPHYTDPRAINRTGRPDGKGTYADLGPFEFVESASSAVDLVASDVSGPAQVGAGDTATLRWTVSNKGSGTATGPWHDAVYLVPLLGGSPVFVTEVLSGEGTALGTGQSLAVSARILAVGVPEGQYQWQIQANSRGDIFEGANWTNNTALASSLTLLTVPQLVIGGPVANNQFTAAGQSLWYKFLPQTNSDVQVNLQATASAGSLEIYLGRGYIPTRDHFDSAGSLGASSSASVIAPNASSQPYYVTVYAQAVPSSPLQFSISSSALDFSLTGAAPNVAGTGGSVTLKVSGGRLRDDMTFSLVGPGGTPHPSLSAWKAQDASVYATFDTTGLPTGPYSLLVNDGASNRSLSNAVSLVAATPGAVSYNVVMPSFIRWGQIRRAVLNYRNTGNTDVLAPVITINAINGTLMGVKMDTRSSVDFGNVLKQPSNTAQLLGINPAGPAGVLPPGFEGAFYFDVMANPGAYSVGMNIEEMLPARAMDWAGFKNSLKPLFLPADAWEAIYGNFTTRVGATTDQYRRLLSDDANYLSRLGHYTADVGLLLGFEIQKANAFGSIGLRYALGIFGRGFADPFNMTAQADANGNVSVGCPSGFREFTRVSAGVYQAGPGDAAVLTDLPGGYRLEEADGVVTVFGSGGKINYIEQPNGWRVTLNYSGGRLAGISNSHGDALTYAYNGLGRVATITDPQGRVTTLAYDADGEHLLSATDPAGTTQFTYLTGQGASRDHAISAITFPDGRHLSLQYDSIGRITRQSGDQGANALNFAYDNQAGVTITDGAGGTFAYEFDDLQNLCTVRDPLGRRFTVAYDRQLTPKLLTDAEGNSQAMSFDGSGNLTGLVDWLGLNYTMTYSPANTLVGYANPAGVPLSFTFDQGRNLTGALYPDQTRLGFQRDQLGQLTAWSNRRGQTMRYNLNASGQLANKQFSSGSQETFTYDNHRNLVKIIDAKGTNTYTFDAADRLTGVRYPSGRSLTYAYDAYGRRTQLLADDGYTVKYTYDAGGRLSSPTFAFRMVGFPHNVCLSGLNRACWHT